MFKVELRYSYKSMCFEFETLELAQSFVAIAMKAIDPDEERSDELTATITFKKTYEKEEYKKEEEEK